MLWFLLFRSIEYPLVEGLDEALLILQDEDDELGECEVCVCVCVCVCVGAKVHEMKNKN